VGLRLALGNQCRELLAAGRTGLGHRLVDVAFDRANRQGQSRGNVAVGQTLAEQHHDLAFSIGQPLTTLSGGERQRLKLATRLGDQGAQKGNVFVLDEPTSGLHLADVDQLLGLLDRLVDSGKSVIVIEHHQAVMAHADWIIDLGPGAGHDGGRVVFEGTPADIVADRSTLTGEHLAAYVGA
jgi:ABC-type hemin transport system ATPase subunit